MGISPPPTFGWHLTSDFGDFMVNISYRGGTLVELLKMLWIDNHWAEAIRVTDIVRKEILLECRDQDLIDNDGPFHGLPVISCKP
jgi:hypothetical protein